MWWWARLGVPLVLLPVQLEAVQRSPFWATQDAPRAAQSAYLPRDPAWAALTGVPALEPQSAQEEGRPGDVEIPAPSRPESLWPRTVRARLIWILPRIGYDSREFENGVISGDVNLGETGDLDTTRPGVEIDLDLAPWRFSLTGFHLVGVERLDAEVRFVDDTFPAGTRLRSSATAVWLDAMYGFELASGDGGGLRILAGLHIPKVRFVLDSAEERAEEGYSAVLPAPAFGAEGWIALSETLSLRAGVWGTALEYVNPYKLDGGDSQRVHYRHYRVVAEGVWSLASDLDLCAGLTFFMLHIDVRSVEDRDMGWFGGRGAHIGIVWRM